MLISDAITLKAIKDDFNKKFPYLKLEFYKTPHRQKEASHIEEQLDKNKTIGEVRTVHNEGEFRIDGQMKVSELEKIFRDTYGLNVQVFRRSGNLWLQTSKTDHWTLAEQNRKGGHSESSFREMHNK